MPFNLRRSPADVEWFHFFYAGPNFRTVQGISLGWDLGALLVKYSELDETHPCPPYVVQKEDSFIKLEPHRRFPPTVGHCMKAIATFDFLLELWGYREIAFDFGVGTDITRYQGSFAMGHGPAPVAVATS